MGDRRRFSAWCSEKWAASKGKLAVGFGVSTACFFWIGILQSIQLMERYPVIDWGNVSEAFGALFTVMAVAVALWQSIVIRQQAKDDAGEAAIRLQGEIDAANARTTQEVEAAEARSKQELEHQKELSRVQRTSVREQEFKLALVRVSRAATAYTQELATLVNQAQRIADHPTRQLRVEALAPVSRQLGWLAMELSLELDLAAVFTDHKELRDSLDKVRTEAIKGPLAENDFRNEATYSAQPPNSVRLFLVMNDLPRVIGDARRLAASLLKTGWED